MSKVAVSIVSFNTKNYLDKCVENLSLQKTQTEIEIWVLDNNSEDGSAEMISQKFPKVKLIRSNKNLGFARGQNEILSQAKADYYLIVNPDTQIPGDAVEKMVNFFLENPDCGVTSCKLVGFDGKTHSNGGDLPFNLALLAWLFNLEVFGIKSNFHRTDFEYYQKPRGVGWVGGTFMMVRRQVFEKVGFLDTDYFMYVEDVDFCYRALGKGFKVMINPDVEVKHKSGASSRNPEFYQWKNEFQNLILFYRKNVGIVPSVILRWLIYISAFLRMVMFAILGKGGVSITYAKIIAGI